MSKNSSKSGVVKNTGKTTTGGIPVPSNKGGNTAPIEAGIAGIKGGAPGANK